MRLFSKITTLFVGLTMALGVGLIVDRGNKVEKARAGEQSITINRKSFPEGSLAYANATEWEIKAADSPTGEAIKGTAHLFTNTAMQFNTTNWSLAFRNDTGLAGKIKSITFNYNTTAVKTVSINLSENNSIAEKGTQTGNGPEGITGTDFDTFSYVPGGSLAETDYTFEVESSKDYRYFCIFQVSTGAGYLNYISITYVVGSTGPSVEDIAAAEAFDAKVAEILEEGVSHSNAQDVIEIIEEYNELSDVVLALIDEEAFLVLMNEYDEYLENNAQAVADIFMARVDALYNGEITIDDGVEIADIEANYALLQGTVLALVNADGYVMKMLNIKSRYDAVVEAAQQAADQAAANIVIGMIDALPALVDLELGDANVVQAARAAYDELTATQKALVTNYADLLAAEERLVELDPTASAEEAYFVSTDKSLAAGEYSAKILETGANLTNSYVKGIKIASTKKYTECEWYATIGALQTTSPAGFWLGTNGTQTPQMILEGYVPIKSALAQYSTPDTNTRIAVMEMANFYVNQPTELTLSWGGISTTSGLNVYLMSSSDNGNSWAVLAHSKENNAATAGSLTWQGLNFINENCIKFAIVITSADATGTGNNANLRTPIIAIKALGETTTTYVGPVEAVTGVSINPTSLTLGVGKTATVAVSVLPSNATNKDYIIISNDEEIATVTEAGLVTAVAEGNTEIVVLTDDGDFEAECAITVIGAPTNEYIPDEKPNEGNDSVQMGNVDFVQTMTGHTYVGYIAGKGAQYGSASSTGVVEFESALVSFTMNDLERVVVNMSTSGAAGHANLAVYVGNQQIGETVELTNAATDYVFIPNQGGSQALGRLDTEEGGHLRIVATGNGICFGGMSIYGAEEAIEAGLSSDMAVIYEMLLEADPCVDYTDAPAYLELLEELDAADQATVRSAIYVSKEGTVETLGDKLDYMLGLYEAELAKTSGLNPLSQLVRSSSSLIAILVIGITGLTAIGAYYFINKKRLASR